VVQEGFRGLSGDEEDDFSVSWDARTHQRLLNIGKATETGFKPTIKSLEDEMDEMAGKDS
jgi:hypothetical protein